MDDSSKYGYTGKKKPNINGLLENNHKNVTNCNGHETNESSDSVSSEDNQMTSQKEMSSGTSRSSSRDGTTIQNGSLSQDGVHDQSRQSSQETMLMGNGISMQSAMSTQGELHLQQDGSGRVQSRKQRTFTPEVSKDPTYWEKRRKNNEAARRSREKRRRQDLARERSVQEITAQNKYLITQLCILKRRVGIPVTDSVESPNDDAEQIEIDCRNLLAALMAQNNGSGPSGSMAGSLGFHRTSPNIPTASTSYPDMANQNSLNGDRQNHFNLSPADSAASNYSMKSFKSEPAQQPMASQLNFEIVPLNMIKQEPQEDFSNATYPNSNATPRSIDSFTKASEMFENTTSSINMVRDAGDLIISGRRSFSTSPSPWYPLPGVAVGHHGQLTNGIDLTNHANSTPSPTSSSSSINFSMNNGHSIPPLPAQEDDEPLQLTVSKRRRLDSENSSETTDPAEDLPWNRNSRNCLSSPTVNSNSQRSAHSLPLKLRHKVSLPDHTIALTHSLTPTTMISSTAFGNSSLANLNHPQTNGLSHLSDVALSQNRPVPLLKRDANGQLLSQRNSQCKENDSTCVGSNSLAMNNGESPSSEDLDSGADCKTSGMQLRGSSSSKVNNERIKDPKYLERRRRNNEAARKCRENRKTAHKSCVAWTHFYEKKNKDLKDELAKQQRELGHLQLLWRKKQENCSLSSSNDCKEKNNDESDEGDGNNNNKNI